jgi:hypothetical protein
MLTATEVVTLWWLCITVVSKLSRVTRPSGIDNFTCRGDSATFDRVENGVFARRGDVHPVGAITDVHVFGISRKVLRVVFGVVGGPVAVSVTNLDSTIYLLEKRVETILVVGIPDLGCPKLVVCGIVCHCCELLLVYSHESCEKRDSGFVIVQWC